MMKPTSPFIVLSVFAVTAFFIFGNVRSTASGPGVPGGSNPAGRSSVPKPKNVVAKQEPAPEIAQSAWLQIQSLLEEKAARTPAQRKIDSQLL